jgi:hypothetical protein
LSKLHEDEEKLSDKVAAPLTETLYVIEVSTTSILMEFVPAHFSVFEILKLLDGM